MNIRTFLNQRVRNAMSDAGIPADYSPHLALGKREGSGDYQANGAMAAAKAMKKSPRDVAQDIISHLELEGIAENVDVAGPGFINIHLSNTWLAKALEIEVNDLAQQCSTEDYQTVVVDYSSPNLAKEMHVGHLRSTIIGDAVARILEYLGHKVIRQNHVGDWGTQFGMLLAELEDTLVNDAAHEESFALEDLEGFYRQSKAHFDADESFANRARDYVVKLQAGDGKLLELWAKFRHLSLQHSDAIYRRLNVSLTENDVRGESTYNNDLAPLVEELIQKKLAVENEGAKVVFLPELADKNGDPSPVIVQKKDGGYLYATTDLAALRYRAKTLDADRVLYFIDARQSLHMQQVFTLAKKAGFVDEWLSLEHHPFGTMMGADGKPFKTRSGDTVKLADLLEEAVVRAKHIVLEKNPQLSDDIAQSIAQKVGIGAIKYADLAKTRTHDYIFSWESMLSFEGNTGPYLQYAYSRICSIFTRANVELSSINHELILETSQERALAFKTLQFKEIIEQVAQDAFPHILCNYLYELASSFMTFYEACPILKENVSPDTRNSRLQLSQYVAARLRNGLSLLGIEVMEKM